MQYLYPYLVFIYTDKEKPRWDGRVGEYCCCVLYKEAVDTMQAVNVLAKMLR